MFHQIVQPTIQLSLLSLLSMGLVSCSRFTTVQAVQKQPHRHWFNRTVHLQGTVVDRAPLIDALVYQLQDDTGKIWVLTTHPQLDTGERVQIKGDVRFESIVIAGQEWGDVYIEEQQREKVEPDYVTDEF